MKVETLGEGAGKGDGVGFGDKGDGIGGGAEGVFEPIGDEFAIGEGIDADEVKKLSGMIRERGDELEGGGEFANGGIVSEKGISFSGRRKPWPSIVKSGRPATRSRRRGKSGERFH